MPPREIRNLPPKGLQCGEYLGHHRPSRGYLLGTAFMLPIFSDKRILQAVAFLAACCFNIQTIVAADDPAMIKAICQKGTESFARLEVDPASWTITRPELPYATTIDVIRHGNKYRWITKSADGKELCRVICHDNVWYVLNSDRKSGKFRPYEATLISPSSYAHICRSNPRPAHDVLPIDNLRLKSGDESNIVLNGPLMESALETLNGVEAMLRSAIEQNPKRLELKETLEGLIQKKDAGLTITVDPQSGFVQRIDCGESVFAMTDFKWLDNVPNEVFEIKDRDWTDYTKPLIEARPGDCALLVKAQHLDEAKAPSYRNLVKADLTTGKYRRIPCRVGPASAGCFSKDRTKVYAVAVDINVGLHRIIEIDLKSGRNRDFCEDLLDGMLIYPAISQEGTKLSVLNRGKGMNVEHTQLCVIDLATRQVTKIGQPGNFISPRWLAGDAGFCLIQNKPDNPPGEEKVLCQMSMEGELKELRPAKVARPLGSLPRIIFDENGVWMTCDLDGKDTELLSEKFQGLTGVEPSADGKTALMAERANWNPSPLPCLVELETGKRVPVPVEDGYWGLVSW
jgi:hypothetical protein